MKRIILIALVCSRLVFCLDAFSLQFDETAGFEKNDVESGISLSDSVTGVKVGFPVFDGRFYWNGDKYSYGVSLNSQSFMKSFPLQFKWGKLSSGGGFSKINNPLLSTSVSPFSLPSSSVNPITANLTSSFSKSDSLFFQAGYKKIAKLNFLFMAGENISVSTLVNVIFGKKINLSASLVYENYYYESKKSDSWYNDFVFYHNGNGNALYSQLSFSYGGVSTLFSCGVYE